MNLSNSVEYFLNKRQIPFDLVQHGHTKTSLQTARSARIAPNQLAKAVVVKERDHYLMCVLPATHQLVLRWLDRERKCSHRLAMEEELRELFPDCETGAVPALGEAYGMKVLWDNSLRQNHEIYFEAGDHRHLIHLGHIEFMALMSRAEHATIACTPDMVDFNSVMH